MKRARRDYHVIIEQDEDGYLVAEVPELPGCHTQAKSLNQLMTRIKEAILLWQEARRTRSRSTFVGIQRIAV